MEKVYFDHGDAGFELVLKNCPYQQASETGMADEERLLHAPCTTECALCEVVKLDGGLKLLHLHCGAGTRWMVHYKEDDDA